MVKDLMDMLSGRSRLDGEAPNASLEDGALVIDCNGCGFPPVPGSDECISCMVRAMCAVGGSSRVILRTGEDLEVSGRSGKAIRDAASLRLWSLATIDDRGRCSRCGVSRGRVMGRAWSTFPEDGIRYARAMLDDGAPEGDGCDRCVERTREALRQLEHGMEELLDRMGTA